MNRVIEDFGSEWQKFHYLDVKHDEFIKKQFRKYLLPISIDSLSLDSTVAADFGAGSGRWTREIVDYVKIIHAIEPSDGAFRILDFAFHGNKKVITHHCTIQDLNLKPSCLDFAMSLGVLHHIDDTQGALNRIFYFLKPGGSFLGYLYYNFENKTKFYKLIWKLSNFIRGGISHLPNKVKASLADLIALLIYWPLARLSYLLNKMNVSTENLPLHQYSQEPFYVMRNDSLDRFGTRLEKRFTKSEITEMLLVAGAEPATIRFSPEEPFWCFSATKR